LEYEWVLRGGKKLGRLRWLGLVTIVALGLSLGVFGVVAESGSADLGQVAGSLFTSPSSILVFVIELFLGIGLGYVSLKALKYLLAFAALTLLGVLLNVWQAPLLASQLGAKDILSASSQFLAFAYTLGLTTVMPLTVGFIVGAIIGTLR
jgi:hypothetical protein